MPREGFEIVQSRLIELFYERPANRKAAVQLVDVAGAACSFSSPLCRPEELYRVTDPLGSNQSVSRPGQQLLEQRRHPERSVNMVEDPHDDGVVTGGLGGAQGLVG